MRFATLCALSLLLGCQRQGLQVSSQTCAVATDAAACTAIAGCSPAQCPLPGGGQTFIACIPTGQPYAAADCPGTTCRQHTDATSCNAQAGCYARSSGDLPCNESSCIDHFVSCEAAPPVCSHSTATCSGSCTTLTPHCRAGEALVYDASGCCAIGCAPSAACGVTNGTDGGAGCTRDADCGVGAYCRGLLSVCRSECQYTIGTALGAGTCHRSCEGPSSCNCSDDADCPGAFTHCDTMTHQCVSEQPPICHSPACPAGCQEGTLEEYGAICVCPSC